MTEQEEKVVEQKLSLVEKLVKITESVKRIPKNGYNDFHKYAYALESDIKEVVREELTKHGLILISNEKSREVTTIQAKNGTQQMVSLQVEFTIRDQDSSDSITFTGYGDGQDSGDKAVYKAKTGALKYALTSLFLIPTGDDPETNGKPLQPPKVIGADQVKYLQDLGMKVANLSGQNGNTVVGQLKVDLKNNKDFDKYNEEEFSAAVKILKEWEQYYIKKQQQANSSPFGEVARQQPAGNQNQQNNNIPWGMN